MMSKWEDLPYDLVYVLSERLVGLSTFLRFGAVCRCWHLFTLSNSKYNKPVPWLMLAEKEGTDIREFYDISTNELYELPLPQAQGRKIVGSAHGWVMTAGGDMRFHWLNPLDGAQIELPGIHAFHAVRKFKDSREDRDMFMRKATWSANPASSRGDIVVMAIHTNSGGLCLSYWSSTDKEWTSFEALFQEEITFARGQFFAFAGTSVLSCDISNKSEQPQHAEIASTTHNNGEWGRYIAERGDDILYIEKEREFDHPKNFEDSVYRTLNFHVYKVDFDGKKLVEVKDIGDYALFLGYNNSFSLQITSDYYSAGFKRNCIYFTDDYSDILQTYPEAEGGEDMGVYSMKDKSIEPFYPGVSKSTFSFPIWFIPDPSDHSHDSVNAKKC